MSDRNKQAARAAAAIHEAFVQSRSVPMQISLPDSLWQECERLARRMHKARQHHWVLAARRLCQSLHQNLCILDRRVNDVSSALAHGQNDVRLASTREIYRDLVALRQEFSDVECSFKRHTISVVTEEITLERVELGRFEIVLDLRCLHENQPYEITAVDSNPPASNADVTHPHVEAAKLCEGDGRAANRPHRGQVDWQARHELPQGLQTMLDRAPDYVN